MNFEPGLLLVKINQWCELQYTQTNTLTGNEFCGVYAVLNCYSYLLTCCSDLEKKVFLAWIEDDKNDQIKNIY